MTIFTMYRNCIFRLHKGVDQLNLLLAGMSGYMCILENNLCTFHGKLVDNLGYSLLITWNRMRAENNCIIRFNGNLLVDISSHTGKSSHGLALTSCSDQNKLLIRIVLYLVDLDQSLVRNTQIAKFCGSGNNIYHTAAFYCHFTSKAVCGIDDLLYTVYIGSKRCDNDSCSLIFIKKIVKNMTNCALRHGKARTFRICRIAHKGKNAFPSDFRKSLQINGISKYRGIVHLEVTCVYHDSHRRINSQCRCILDTMVRLNKFNSKITKIDHLTVFYFF